jgi:hypothetical protein
MVYKDWSVKSSFPKEEMGFRLVFFPIDQEHSKLVLSLEGWRRKQLFHSASALLKSDNNAMLMKSRSIFNKECQGIKLKKEKRRRGTSHSSGKRRNRNSFQILGFS